MICLRHDHQRSDEKNAERDRADHKIDLERTEESLIAPAVACLDRVSEAKSRGDERRQNKEGDENRIEASPNAPQGQGEKQEADDT